VSLDGDDVHRTEEASMSTFDARIRTTRTWDNGRLITLAGEIGRWDALNLDEQLLDAFDEGELAIVVDVSEVTRLEPIVLSILLEAAERQERVAGELFLAARDDSRLGYELRPLSSKQREHGRGLHPELDRLLDRDPTTSGSR
jgi:anti-anti-sigma regulatory factor